ncbi:MAG: WbqC family protein [Selenomonadaceae bacterium]|nr:WbqC family protein [Selenomonadaceae bacterium]
MTIAIMQPYFFPYLGYWQLLTFVDRFVVLDDVDFIKRGWINRNNILLNGESHMFTIPLDKCSQNKLISETRLKFPESAKDKFLRTIQMSYSKAPYFTRVYPLLREIIYYETDDLTDFICDSFQKTLEYLGINQNIIRSSGIEKDDTLTGQDRILEICGRLSAKVYINPIGGLNLYDKEKFFQNGILLNFIKMKNIEYRQFKNDFVKNLSFIDVLMFNDISEIKTLLSEYELL